jgi:hypothetical protein
MLCLVELLSFACQLCIAHHEPHTKRQLELTFHAAKPKGALAASSDIGCHFAAFFPEIAHGRRKLNV